MAILKGLIFDLDGTLINNMDFHLQAWHRFFIHHQLDTTSYREQIHGTNGEILRRIFQKPLTDEEVQELAREKESVYRNLYQPHIQPIRGLRSFFSNVLSASISLGLATMSGQENINFSLQHLGFRDHFSAITGAHEVRNGKPDPEVFNKTIEDLRLSPNECVIFEDSHTGIVGAKATGAKVVGITSGHTMDELISWGADLAIRDYEEISLDKCKKLVNDH